MLPLLLAFASAELFELNGRLSPRERASVSLYRVASPFAASTLAEEDGRFTFKKLESGAYTVAVFVPSKGEARRLVQSGGVYVNNRRETDPQARLTRGQAIGGRLFVLRKGQKQNHLVRIS